MKRSDAEASPSARVYQDLRRFAMPPGFRGRSGLWVQAWWCVQATLFRASPQFLYGWRRFLLRLFGARVGAGAIIRPSVTVTYPWKVTIGDHAWVGDDAILYSLGEITIGDHAVVSQKCHLCAGTHDPYDPTFPILGPAIHVGAECWLAADVFVAPGKSIGRGTLVGARSSVFHDLPEGVIARGSPARVTGRRLAESQAE